TSADVVAKNVHSQGSRLAFTVDGYELRVPSWGRHNLAGALAAVAVGKIFGYSMADIARGLDDFQPPPDRRALAPCETLSLLGADDEMVGPAEQMLECE